MMVIPTPAISELLPISHGSLQAFSSDPLRCLSNLHRQHGDVAALDHDGMRIHFVFAPDLNRQVLSDAQTFHSRFFAIRGPRQSAQRRLTSGLLSMNGDEHKQNRRLVMEAFTRKAVQGYLPTIRLLSHDLLRNWRSGQVYDLSREMTEFMLRLTSSMLFGLDDCETAYALGGMIDRWVHLNHEMGIAALVSDLSLTGRYQQLLEDAAKLETEITAMIDRRRQGQNEDQNVLSLILQAHDQQGSMSTETLVGQAALIYAAAHLTTAHSLTWTLLLLAQHPDAMSRLHAELQQELDPAAPWSEQMDRLPWLEACIKESMRILPASAYSQRITSSSTRLGPFDLMPGAGVIFSQFITHRRADLYSDPNRFQPERWAQLSPSPYAYLPFGAGPRMCLGAPLAMAILKAVLPMILQRFKLTSVPGTSVDAKVVSTMLSPTTPVWMRLDPQDGNFVTSRLGGNVAELVAFPDADDAHRRAA